MTIDELPQTDELKVFIEKYGKESLIVGPRVISLDLGCWARPILWKDGDKTRKVGAVPVKGP